MLLYHGSYMEVKKPKIIISDIGRDFGFAFYLTPIKEQAERMAKRKLRMGAAKAFVNIFEWDEDKKNLNYLNLNNADSEWLKLVIKCRTDSSYNHGFDIIEGKIADDSVGETILFVLGGVITEEVALERLKFQKINSQIAFCSEQSLSHLKYIDSYEVI